MLKKFLSIILLCMLVFQSSLTVFANTDNGKVIGINTPEQEAHNKKVEEQHQEVVNLIRDLTKLKMQQNSLSKENISMKEATMLISDISELENQLDKLGIKKVSTSFPQKLNSLDNSMLIATSSSYEDTREELISRFYVNGLPYTVLHIYSIPNSINSVQVSTGDGVPLYSGNGFLAGVSNIISIYAQKVIGTIIDTIPVIAWMPYELLIPSNANKVEALTVSYTAGNTVCYSWVKPYSASDSYYKRGMVTNHMTCESYFSSRGVRSDGSVFNQPSGLKYTEKYADNYANTAKAVYSYVNEFCQYESILSSVQIKCDLPGGVTKTVRIVAPR